MKKINIMYICHAAKTLGGASQSLLDMILSVRDFVNPIIITNTTGLMYERFVANGIRCYNFPFQENIRPGFIKFLPSYILYRRENNRMLRLLLDMISTLDLQIDIIHSNSSVFTFGYELAQRLRIPHVWHIREMQDVGLNIYPYLGRKNLKKKIWKSDACIGISKSLFDHWELSRSPKSYCRWDAVRSLKDVYYQKDKEPYFLFCSANLDAPKGVREAIESFYMSGLYKEGYQLKIIGKRDDNSNYIKEIDNYIVEHNLTDLVKFYGLQKDVKPFFVNATAFLMCSVHEAMGRVTVESMFYGCPVIGYNVYGTKDLLQDGKYGFPFDSYQELPSIMKKVAYNDYSDLIMSAQQFAIEEFSIESYGDFIKKVYSEVLGHNINE